MFGRKDMFGPGFFGESRIFGKGGILNSHKESYADRRAEEESAKRRVETEMLRSGSGMGAALNATSGAGGGNWKEHEERKKREELDKLRYLERRKKWNEYMTNKKLKAQQKRALAKAEAKRQREQDACDAEMYRMMGKGPDAKKKPVPTLSRGNSAALSQSVNCGNKSGGQGGRAITLRGDDSNRFMTQNIQQQGFAPSSLKKF